jgi:hypothetical protein
MMTVTEARALARSMGLRLEEYKVGEDKFLVRDASTDLWVTYIRPFAVVAEWLKFMEARGPREYDATKRNYESALGLIGQTADTPPNPVLPSCGSRRSEERGWTVWVRNDQPYWVSCTLRWWAGGQQRRLRLNLPPECEEWLSSDGDGSAKGIQRPRDVEVVW